MRHGEEPPGALEYEDGVIRTMFMLMAAIGRRHIVGASVRDMSRQQAGRCRATGARCYVGAP